ncbi:heme peroxidase [Cooperia oncophora]
MFRRRHGRRRRNRGDKSRDDSRGRRDSKGDSKEDSRSDSGSEERHRSDEKGSRDEKSKSDGSRCIRLTRALNAQKGLGVRTQINQNTHFLDLSSVYGSEECEGASVRSFVNGELKTYSHNGELLPPQNKNDSNCLSTAPYYCFTTGDFRNSLHPGLIPIHTAYIKEHNRLAALLKKSNPSWTDERVFQEARRVNIAQYQHQVYSEYLPLIIPPSVNAALSAEFAGAAFRFGHGTARKDFPRVTNGNKTAGTTVDIGSNIFYVDSHYAANQGGQASFIEGMMQYPAMKSDKEFSFPIRNQLFRNPGPTGIWRGFGGGKHHARARYWPLSIQRVQNPSWAEKGIEF